MLLVCIFLKMTIWHWIANQSVFLWERPPLSILFSVAYSSLCVEGCGLMGFPPSTLASIGVIWAVTLVGITFGQSHWWDFIGVASVTYISTRILHLEHPEIQASTAKMWHGFKNIAYRGKVPTLQLCCVCESLESFEKNSSKPSQASQIRISEIEMESSICTWACEPPQPGLEALFLCRLAL